MNIIFEPKKEAENVAKHGISLSRAAELVVFNTIEDDRFDYGEERIRAYGTIDGLAYCLVFTMRGESVRVISLRRAHAKEMKRYAP